MTSLTLSLSLLSLTKPPVWSAPASGTICLTTTDTSQPVDDKVGQANYDLQVLSSVADVQSVWPQVLLSQHPAMLRGVTIKLVTSLLLLYLINTRLAFSPFSPSQRSSSLRSGQETLQAGRVELDMRERRDLLRRTCSKYANRLKVPLKLYNKKLRSDENILLKSLWLFSGSI